jgi:predicted nuclease of predicted toxin-antitoxin system
VKILLDTCVAGQAKAQLQAAGHDVVWSGDWDQDPGDEAILAAAFREGRVLVTIDKDFGELAVLRGASHCGILRLVNFRAAEQAPVCLEVLSAHGADLQSGAIITAEPGRVRIRRRPV